MEDTCLHHEAPWVGPRPQGAPEPPPVRAFLLSIGKDVKDTDIHASFKDGILTITVPKQQQKKELPEHNYITIE